MALSTKYYLMIARAINLVYRDINIKDKNEVFIHLINRIGLEFKADNPRFSLIKFTNECLK